MKKWIKNKSLVFSSSLVLALLCLTLIMVMNYLSYDAQKKAIYNEFLVIGKKLQAQAQANAVLIEGALNGDEGAAGTNNLEILKRLLNAMTDDVYIANAYYYATDIVENEGQSELKLIQVTDSIDEMGLHAGDSYAPNDEYIESFQKAVDHEAGLSDPYEDEYGAWMAYLGPIKGEDGKTIAVLGIDYDYDKVQAKLNQLVLKSSMIALVVSMLAIALVIILVKIVVRPLRILVDHAKQAANGDLTVQMPIINGNEIGQAAQSFNEMVKSLRELTIHIDHTSQDVSEASIALKETAGQTEAATNEIATAIQSVASSADTQLASAQECQRAMMEMTIGIQRIAESSSTVSELATDTSQLAAQGEKVIAQTVGQITTIEQKVTGAANVMQELNESSARINDIIGQITEIADQTNLLALNASIEAARAGEYGKGFAVVAQEIRKLAERSKVSSHEIATILHIIGTKTEGVATTLSESAYETKKGTELVHASGESFHRILQAVNQVSVQVEEVSAASEQMSAGSEEIAASMVELERTANTSASRSQEVAAASEEQLASVEEVASSSEQLQRLAQQLREAVGRFKV